VLVKQPPVDLTLHGMRPSAMAWTTKRSAREPCALSRAHASLLFSFCQTHPGHPASVHFQELRSGGAIEALLLSYPQGHPPVLCSSRFGRIVRHRVFPAVTLGAEAVGRNAETNQLLSHVVCPVL
jgi:hypothetical protein